MQLEIKTLMDDNEMLSHIFLGCIPHEQLIEIKNKFVGEQNWKEKSVTIPVNLKIAGVDVNPKLFFDNWKNQMQDLIIKTAQELVADKLGSNRMRYLQDKLNTFEEILRSWEDEINWEVENPLL